MSTVTSPNLGLSLHPTRHRDDGQQLFYAQVDRDHWQCVHRDSYIGRDAQVGPLYPTLQQLLADLERFAGAYGFPTGTAPVRPVTAETLVEHPWDRAFVRSRLRRVQAQLLGEQDSMRNQFSVNASNRRIRALQDVIDFLTAPGDYVANSPRYGERVPK